MTLHGDPDLDGGDLNVPAAVQLRMNGFIFTIYDGHKNPSHTLPSDSDSEKSHHGIGNQILQEEN